MRRLRKTKIVATLGPASADPTIIRQLFEAGADVFRLNMSHTNHRDAARYLDAIRRVEQEMERPIGVVVDLQGPKLRIGDFDAGAAELVRDQTFTLDMDATPGDENRVMLPHPEVYQSVTEGTEILLDDGRVRLEVTEVGEAFLKTRVLENGRLSNRKGVNVPKAVLPLGPLTDKDRQDLEFALEAGVDWIALSFIQRPEDVRNVRAIVGSDAAILAKIEKPVALDHLHEILTMSDAIMVARGDLGVELPPEDVPGVQKKLIREARRMGKVVVVATQMLESMIKSSLPTRAEVSDVANAIYEGADAVMLSAESAAGEYPVDAVAMMDRVAQRVERDPMYHDFLERDLKTPDATTADAITIAARQVADTIGASVIISYTTSGSTARRAARQRPTVPILALTPRLQTARQLAVTWGLHCVETEDARNFKEMVDKACSSALEQEFAGDGDRIVITAGVPFGTSGTTNILRVAEIGAPVE